MRSWGGIGVDRGLKKPGFKEENIDKAAESALAKPYWNPRHGRAGTSQGIDQAGLGWRGCLT